MSDIQIIVGILFIFASFILLLVIRAKMTPPVDYSDATKEVINRINDNVMMTQYQEFIARQDEDFRAGR